MAVWPAGLPQISLASGFEERADSVLIRSSVDVGPAKVRPRYTTEVKRYTVPLLLTKAQVATLETFFTVTIVFGSLTFDWVDQRTGASATLRLTNRPSYIEAGPGYWSTQLELEKWP